MMVNSSTNQQPSISSVQFPLSRREVGGYLLLSSLIIALLLGGLLLVRLALPHDPYVEVGPLADYPPSSEPYLVLKDSHQVYLVNDGTSLIALDPLYRAPSGAIVRWQDSWQAFIDPGRGTRFNLQGINTVTFTPDDRPLARYRLKVEDGTLWILDQPASDELWELTLPSRE